MPINALIFGVGGPTILGLAKSLRLATERSQLRLIGVDGDPFAPGLYNRSLFDATCLNGFVRDGNYWEIVETIIDRESIDVAFMVPEPEVLAWSERQAVGGLPCKALVPDWVVAKSMYDKMACNLILQETGLVPETLRVDRESSPAAIAGHLGYPYWVRKAEGAGALGAFKIECQQDLVNWMAMNPGLDALMASEFLPGRNYACKVLYANGKLLRAACGERISYLLASTAPSGISGMCARGRLINHTSLIERADQAVGAVFKHHERVPHGMFTVDFKEDGKGTPKLTEINIRPVSFTYAFALGGANFAHDILQLLIQGELSEPNYKEYRFEDEPHFIRGVDSEIMLVHDNDLVRKFSR